MEEFNREEFNRENFNREEYEKHVQYELKHGLNRKRKKEIRAELKAMSKEEVNREIEELYNALNPILYDNLTFYYDIFEILLVALLEGKYVVKTSNKIDKTLKNKFNDLIKKTELALKFAKKYFYSEISFRYLDLYFYDIPLKSMDLNDFLSLETDTINKHIEYLDKINTIENKFKKILETSKNVEKENEEYLKEYQELYRIAIELYINKNSEYRKYLKQIKILNKKINLNNKMVPTKEELDQIFKKEVEQIQKEYRI